MRTREPVRRRTWWLLLLLALAPAAPACNQTSEVVAAEPWPAGLAKPSSVEQATALKAAGTIWTDVQVRRFYLERVAEIGPADAAAVTRGDALELRAHAAFSSRHDARMIARAMMQSPAELAALQARDRDKYGHPDGPTFEWLVERAGEKGLTGDAVFTSIVDSAQITAAGP